MKWFVRLAIFFLAGFGIGWYSGKLSAVRSAAKQPTFAVINAGLVNCVFDGPAIAGHLVAISETRPGLCHDLGSNQLPRAGQVIGIVSYRPVDGAVAVDLFDRQ